MASKKNTKKKGTAKRNSVGKNILVSIVALVIGVLVGYVAPFSLYSAFKPTFW